MNNKILAILFGAIGLASASISNATTFVNVSFLGSPAIGTSNGRSYTTINSDQRWTRDKVYIIDRLTFVASGVNIYIEPGTLVRGEIHTVQGDGTSPTKPSDPGALIISNGAKLIANGTADASIIFTSIDDINVPGGLETVPPFENYGTSAVGTDIEDGAGVTLVVNTQRALRTGGVLVGLVTDAEYQYSGGTANTGIIKSYAGNAKAELDGRWGGIVLCGDARVAYGTYTDVIAAGSITSPTSSASASNNGGAGRQYVEGLQAFGQIAMYGGVDDDDNSGTLRFISNRYGGYILFSNREINAFTFGGVGRGTVLEFLESYNNADDDFEFFGGTVNAKYLISAFGGDDGFDTDQGYTGNVQYLVQIQNNRIAANGTTSTGRNTLNVGDNGFEIDGPEPTTDIGVITMRPFTIQTVANATVIGRGYGLASGDTFPANNCGVNLKNAGALRLYNSIYMDFPNGGIAVKTGTPVEFIVGNVNGLYGDTTLDPSGTATTDNERYSVFKGNIWYRCALTENTANTQASVASGAAYTAITVGTGADNTGKLFGVNNRASSATDNPQSVIDVLMLSANSNKFNVDPGLVVPLNHHFSGIDLRCTTSDAKDGGVTLPNRGNLTRVDKNGTAVTFVGAMRDNNWAKGWTALDQLGYLATTSAAIVPSVAISLDGTNPKLTFATVSSVYYTVEKSSDNRVFSPIDIVTGNGSNAEVIDATVTVGSAPSFYRVMAQ